MHGDQNFPGGLGMSSWLINGYDFRSGDEKKTLQKRVNNLETKCLVLVKNSAIQNLV